MELYVHIPFCVRKCQYCDFLSFACEEEKKQQYLHALAQEIRVSAGVWGKKGEDKAITSLFFGGGTPSLLSGEQMNYLMRELKSAYSFERDAEISMEANPGTLSEEKLMAYRAAGINRLSIGCQSVHEDELKTLGRIHSFEDFKENFRLARKAGFTNINVDLMSAIPGQDPASWEDCLETICGFSPEHISAYSLIIEEGTPFFEQQDTLQLPDEDTERRMYEQTRRILSAHGYAQYEISNYAKAGYACRHNIGYWDGTEYLGLGLGASSYANQRRWKNTGDLTGYLTSAKKGLFPKEELEILTPENQMEEFMFLGLRMLRGVSPETFKDRFQKDMYEVYGKVIERFVRENLLTIKENRVCLTEKGLDLANMVMAEFIL